MTYFWTIIKLLTQIQFIMKKNVLFVVICMCILSTYAVGQSSTKSHSMVVKDQNFNALRSTLNIDRRIQFSKDSKSEEIEIRINEKTEHLRLSINSEISEGKLTVEVYDSFGSKQGNYTIETQLSSEKIEKVTGHYEKAWKNLPKGIWKIRIIPTSATANVKINTSLID